MGGFDYTHLSNKRKQRLVERFKHDRTLQFIEVINYDYFILSLICSLPWVLYNIFWRAQNNHWNNRWGAAPHRKCLRELVWIPRSKNGNLWIQRQHWRNKTKCYGSTAKMTPIAPVTMKVTQHKAAMLIKTMTISYYTRRGYSHFYVTVKSPLYCGWIIPTIFTIYKYYA